MSANYKIPPNYKIPLDIREVVVQGKKLPTCSTRESIKSSLELIIMTRFGEHRHDRDYGCKVWNVDFEMILSESKWEDILRQSLLKSFSKYEQRLSDIELDIEINDIQKFDSIKQNTEVKKMVSINLTAVIVKTGEPFSFNDSLFLSPLSID